MGAGMRLLKTVVREIDRSAKASARESARRQRDSERRERQLERERALQAKEDEKLRTRRSKELATAEKGRFINALQTEEEFFIDRQEERYALRMQFINKK